MGEGSWRPRKGRQVRGAETRQVEGGRVARSRLGPLFEKPDRGELENHVSRPERAALLEYETTTY